VDHGAGVIEGGGGDAYRLGIGVIVAWMLIAIVAASRLSETRCRNEAVQKPDFGRWNCVDVSL
jgi:hypothetical protein